MKKKVYCFECDGTIEPVEITQDEYGIYSIYPEFCPICGLEPYGLEPEDPQFERKQMGISC